MLSVAVTRTQKGPAMTVFDTRSANQAAQHAAKRNEVRAIVRENMLPAQRSTPPNCAAPRWSTDGRSLITGAGIVIGGALPRYVAPAMSADAIAIQVALVDRRADEPRLIDLVRAYIHGLHADPKVGRFLRMRIYNAAFAALVRLL